MSNYTQQSIGTCRWCNGPGFVFYGSYTSGSEQSFHCLQCGQSHYAEGDYLEFDKPLGGGYGLLFCAVFDDLQYDEKIPLEIKGNHHRRDEGIACYRLTADIGINDKMSAYLVSKSDWVLQIGYDRDSAPSVDGSLHDLTSIKKMTAALKGSPPSHEELIRVMTASRQSTDEDEPPEDEELNSASEVVICVICQYPEGLSAEDPFCPQCSPHVINAVERDMDIPF
jgi:hypothetical protein